MEFLKLTVPATELVLRCVVIYLVLLLGLRLFGKRTVGQFTLFDLVFILLVSNAVQPAMTGPGNDLKLLAEENESLGDHLRVPQLEPGEPPVPPEVVRRPRPMPEHPTQIRRGQQAHLSIMCEPLQ